MIAQYTAAALVNELKTVAHPASVDTIPTSANQEDHVSMGATSALLLRDAVDRVTTVLAIEALCAARGLDLRAPLRPGRGVVAAHSAVRDAVPPLAADRPPGPDIDALARLIAEGGLAVGGGLATDA
jgi:histidine ammonia-lyase